MSVCVDVEVASELLSDYSSRSTGTGCHFIKMSDKIGLKCYASEERATKAFIGQKWGESLGVAPHVLSDNVFIVGKYWCYTTEVVDILVDIQGEGENGGWQSIDDYRVHEEEEWMQIKEWCYGLVDVGLSYTDCHPGNFGMKDGKPVIIDWDRWFCCEGFCPRDVIFNMLGEAAAEQCIEKFGSDVCSWGCSDLICEVSL